MSQTTRGRHRADRNIATEPLSKSQNERRSPNRHRAPKNNSIKPRSLTALAGIAGVSTVVVTGGSSIPTVNTNIVTKSDDTTTSIPVVNSVTYSNSINTRVQAASRSEERATLEETMASAKASDLVDPTTDLTAVIDTTPTLKNTDIRSIQAISASTEDLETLIAQVQEDANQNAQLLVQQQEIARAAAAEAEAKVADAIKRAEEKKQAAITQAARIEALGKVLVPVQDGYQLSARFLQKGSIWSGGVHTGLDFRVPIGTRVYAAASGTIVESGWAGAYGYRIVIDNGDGYLTTYNHLSKIFETGGFVNAGTNIGLSGSSGNTTGPHLHFEVMKDGEFINPAGWLWGVS